MVWLFGFFFLITQYNTNVFTAEDSSFTAFDWIFSYPQSLLLFIAILVTQFSFLSVVAPTYLSTMEDFSETLSCQNSSLFLETGAQ